MLHGIATKSQFKFLGINKMRKNILALVFFALVALHSSFSEEAKQNSDASKTDETETVIVTDIPVKNSKNKKKDLIVHSRRSPLLFQTFNMFQLESSSKTKPLSTKELNRLLLTLEENKPLVRKANFWNYASYACALGCIGMGVANYRMPEDSAGVEETGALCILFALSTALTRMWSASYRMEAVDNYNLNIR